MRETLIFGDDLAHLCINNNFFKVYHFLADHKCFDSFEGDSYILNIIVDTDFLTKDFPTMQGFVLEQLVHNMLHSRVHNKLPLFSHSLFN